jgi:glycosyltransferase involved in cell wall biosynthesis
MMQASFLVMPSLWYENGPVTLLEAMATGLPVVVSNHGVLAEVVGDNRMGWTFAPGNAAALAKSVRSAWSDGEERHSRGGAARAAYLREFTAEQSYETLMAIYESALTDRVGGRAV